MPEEVNEWDSFAQDSDSATALAKTKVELDRVRRQLYEVKHKHADYIEAVTSAVQGAVAGIVVKPVPKPKKLRAGTGREEVAVALLSDLQTGKITPDYNTDVCRERVMRYAEKIVGITGIQRSDHPVNHLVVPALGDFLEGVDIFPGQCVDDQSEALTVDGWKKIGELAGRQIAVFSPEDGGMSFETPTRLNVFDHDGPMVHHASQGVDHMATENHRMWIKFRKESAWHETTARKVGKIAYFRTAASSWGGEFSPPPVEPTPKCPGWEWACDPSDLAAFVGWFVTEGHTKHGEVGISQSRTANPGKWEEINKLLARILPFMPGQANRCITATVRDDGFTINSTALSAWLRQHFKPGDASTAMLPAWVKAWPVQQLSTLFETMIDGDGTRFKTNVDGQALAYCSTSDRLIDDVQEVCLRLGYTSYAAPRRWAPCAIGGGRTYEGSSVRLNITKRDERVSSRRELVHYTGKVWCPTVSTGWWIVRRNGKIAVTGNSWLIDSTLYRQIFETTPSIVVDFVRYLLAHFDTVTMEAVQGNHGRIGRKGVFGPEDNADRMVYRIVKLMMREEPRFTMNMADPVGERAWYKIMTIGNYKAMLIHGDQIKSSMGYPFYGYGKRIHAWASGGIPEDFQDLMAGHFHQIAAIPFNHRTLWQNGSTESANTYAMEFLAAQSEPSQWLLFVDPAKGSVTASYQVRLRED